MAFKPGASLGQHRTVGQVSIQTLEGRVRLMLERGQKSSYPKAGCLRSGPRSPMTLRPSTRVQCFDNRLALCRRRDPPVSADARSGHLTRLAHEVQEDRAP